MFDGPVYVAGSGGLVGSALVRALTICGSKVAKYSSAEADLRDPLQAERVLEESQAEYVFLAAAKVGGIGANKEYPADFIYDNLMIQANMIHAAARSPKSKVKKMLILGSSCIYPKFVPQPIKESFLMSDKLEPTNLPYAVAKIAGIVMAQSYHSQYGFRVISLMPTNLYGPNDNYHPENSHVLPALISKFHEAKEREDNEVTLWGSGSPRREFLHVDDLAQASIFLMNNYDSPEIINVGYGEDISIMDLAKMVSDIVGYKGSIQWDESKPDGTPRKLLDCSKISGLGWKPNISLENGIKMTYESFLTGERRV